MDDIFRLTKAEDLPRVMEVYSHARSIMRKSGNFNQWNNGYPPQDIIKQDIAFQQHYVLEKEGVIVAVFVFFVGIDPTYNYIEGKWLNNEKYGVIHRIASIEIEKGILKKCLDYCFKFVDNIRIDTHEKNVIMKHLLSKYGFIECGIIYVGDGTPRLAYQKNNNNII